MEWVFSVNEMLKDDITKLSYTLIPPGFQGDVRSVRLMQESLSKLIDALGEQSSTAQGLNKVITTAEKLRTSPTHTLYLLKDPNGKGGRGEVIGMLRVGRKHLFLFDERDKVCEVEPLCVLDFFVLRDRQRHGYGQILFDHMLQDTGASPTELAIDGPSPKMEQFLARHYGIQRLIRQNNNFAVSPQFFAKVGEISKSGRSTPVVTAAVGRFAAPKPPSDIASVIHGGGSYYNETSNGKTSGRATPVEPEPEYKPEPEHKPTQRPSSLRVEPLAVPAAASHAAPGARSPRASGARSPAPPGAPSPAPPDASSPAPPDAPSPAPTGAPADPSPAGSTVSRRDSQLTDRGYFDVKFYHNKLW